MSKKIAAKWSVETETTGAEEATERVYTKAAVGGCGCGRSMCGGCALPPSVPMRMPQRGAGYTTSVPDNHVPYRDVIIDACIADTINSEVTTIAAGATETISIEPSRGCFHAWYVRIEAFAADGEQMAVLLGRWTIDDCALDCREHPQAWTPSRNGDNCVGCPFNVRLGRAANGENLQVDITNPSADTEIQVQVILYGVCWAKHSCLADCPTACPSNGGDARPHGAAAVP